MEDITSEVVEYISTVYKENSPEFIYFVILYNIFNELLEDIKDTYYPMKILVLKRLKYGIYYMTSKRLL